MFVEARPLLSSQVSKLTNHTTLLSSLVLQCNPSPKVKKKYTQKNLSFFASLEFRMDRASQGFPKTHLSGRSLFQSLWVRTCVFWNDGDNIPITSSKVSSSHLLFWGMKCLFYSLEYQVPFKYPSLNYVCILTFMYPSAKGRKYKYIQFSSAWLALTQFWIIVIYSQMDVCYGLRQIILCVFSTFPSRGHRRKCIIRCSFRT